MDVRWVGDGRWGAPSQKTQSTAEKVGRWTDADVSSGAKARVRKRAKRSIHDRKYTHKTQRGIRRDTEAHRGTERHIQTHTAHTETCRSTQRDTQSRQRQDIQVHSGTQTPRCTRKTQRDT